MTAYYTQAQIDEIGALIGQEILNSNEALKQFVQDKIAALEPVTPPAPTEPEAGDGTAPAPAAGMFLDDGREIKTKLIETDANWATSHALHHGLDSSQDIISATFLIEKTGGSYGNEYIPPNQEGVNFYSINAFDGGWWFSDLGTGAYKKGNKLRAFITYLA